MLVQIALSRAETDGNQHLCTAPNPAYGELREGQQDDEHTYEVANLGPQEYVHDNNIIFKEWLFYVYIKIILYTLFLVRIHVYVVDRHGIEDKLVLFSPGFI